MKRILFTLAVLLVTASCATTQKTQTTDFGTLIENRTFDFIAIQRQHTFMHSAARSAPGGSGLIFLPGGFYNYRYKHMGTIIGYPGNYTLSADDNGWEITFSFLYDECGEPLEVLGCEGEYRYRLSIDKDGKAVLEKSSSHNGHKYKDIYTGYITRNQNR